MAISGESFRKVLGHFATGVTIVTVRLASGKPFGFTVNAFTSVSLNPPLVLFCVGHYGDSFTHTSEAEHFAINLLGEGQAEISQRFAVKHPDRFEGIEWVEGVNGPPLLAGCLGFLECKKVASHIAGDHTIVIGEVLEAEAGGGEPLLFYRSAYGRLEAAVRSATK